MLNVVLIGQQGSGKGTQAERMVQDYGLAHIEAGALIRKRAEKHDRKAEIIDHLANKKGQLLPDGIVLEMIYQELAERVTEKGYLFDGFPRTAAQYLAFTELLAKKGWKLKAGVYLRISDEETMRRLEARRLCEVCQKGYSLLWEPDREKCDCGGNLIKRSDDTPEAIRQRLGTFHDITQPVLDYMKEDKVLVEINGGQAVDQVYEEIKRALQDLEG
jgi:adenylate kinase